MERIENEGGQGTGPWRRRLVVLGLAVALQGGLLGLAVFIGVLEAPAPREGRLRLPGDSPVQQRAREMAMRQELARMERAESARVGRMLQDFVDSQAPKVPVPRPELLPSVQSMGALLPLDGAFRSGLDGLGATTPVDLAAPEPVAFLGQTVTATRIVLLLDVSASVKSKIERAGMSMKALREEMLGFVNQLGPNHLFGIIQFTRKHEAFRDQLVPATETVKGEAREWIAGSFRTTGTSGRNWTGGYPNGIEAVLAKAFAMDPQIDEVFLVSDGDFQRTPPGGGGQDVPWGELRARTRALQEQSIGQTRLRVLCFFPPESALPDLRAWTRENGDGRLEVIGENR